MADQFQTSAARLNCLCDAINISGSILSHPTLPIPNEEICHCNPCRYVTGGLLPSFPTLKHAPPADILAKCAVYATSERCNRYFCKTCGSHMFVEHPQKDNEWYCNGGIIEPPKDSSLKDVIQITSHAFIDDVQDGGLAPLLLAANKTSALFPAVRGDNPISPEDVAATARKALQHPLPGPDDKLSVKCHCGGVSLLVDRADYNSNPHNVTPRQIPQNKDKYYAWFCTCRSCRLATGYSLQPMAYIPPGAIRNARNGELLAFGDAALEPDANEGLKLGHYRASEQAQRSFCTGCGATVFYAYLGEDGDGVVDISVGILRAESGAMAREWLEWKEGFVSHEEEMVDDSVLEGVKRGWKAVGLGQ
jgi:hypothetical protein